MAIEAVQHSKCLERILSVPRRTWGDAEAKALALDLTGALKARLGTMTLRPIQAIALLEMGQHGGALLPIRVGGGKSLVSLLAPRMFRTCRRPLLVLPAHLILKTKRELKELRQHWIIPKFINIISYQALSRINCSAFLDNYQPDVIVCDEAHYLKNPSAACTKRMARYLKPRVGQVAFVAMSGTFTNRSVKEFAHLSSWALGDATPLPTEYHTLDEWSRALDVNVAEYRRISPGALNRLRSSRDEPLRSAFRRRLVGTPGVVATQEPPLPIELTFRSHMVRIDPKLEQAYKTLREDWTTPDDWPIDDASTMWRHARELANGFYSVWDPRPPDSWREARCEWSAAVRSVLTPGSRLDTELQVRRAVETEQAGFEKHAPALDKWKSIGPTFKPNAVPVWVSDKTVKWIEKWAAENGPALIWTDRPALGKRIGIKYYGQGGLASDGSFIEDHDPSTQGSAVLSIDANKEGRNLQHKWHRNLILDVPPNGKRWEQMIGRTHRDGQPMPEVTVDVLFGCREDVTGFWRAVSDSAFAEEVTGQAQKLSHANLDLVLDVEALDGYTSYQWSRPATQ